jgi:hypothetical protein
MEITSVGFVSKSGRSKVRVKDTIGNGSCKNRGPTGNRLHHPRNILLIGIVHHCKASHFFDFLARPRTCGNAVRWAGTNRDMQNSLRRSMLDPSNTASADPLQGVRPHIITLHKRHEGVLAVTALLDIGAPLHNSPFLMGRTVAPKYCTSELSR